MPLNAGMCLGPYEILSAIGAGGMGEVYRAKDTRLKRDVAIKVLPDSFATDPERLARFHREAELLATLNHPNIAAVYGLEQADGTTAIVLELIDGETLADLIARGPLAAGDAWPIARQIAEALDAAHEKGVIHRDLKPANIKVTPNATVKVLDFGLAAVVQGSNEQEVNATHSPTLTLAATRAGVILGTAAYMSPEQASGKSADKRSDIWSFGVVLWEMLTGKRLFEGETISHTLAFVITKEPDWTALPANTPPSIHRLLRRCLEKDRKRRLPDIRTARLEIDEALTAPSSTAFVTTSSPVLTQGRWRRALPWALTATTLAVLGSVLALWPPWRTATAPTPVRLSSEMGADTSLALPGAPGANLALSPDGKVLVFAAAKSGATESQLYVRRLDQLQATGLSGTDEARNPFFSPDGQWIGFFARGNLKKISVTGGAAVTLCDAPAGRGGAWAEDGTIAFTPSGNPSVSLLRVSSAGGKPEPLTKLADGELLQRWPQILPGGKSVLFTSNENAANFDEANIAVQPLPDGPRKIVQRGGYYGRYVASGHLLYMHGGTMFAAPFNLDRLELTGQPVPALEGVNSSMGTGGAQFAVSGNGTIVYLSGQTAGNDAPIMWMDQAGKSTQLRSTAANWSNPHFSPDGSRLAIDIAPATGDFPDVWVYEWTRDTLTRLTFDPAFDLKPVWTPDGRRIAFTATRSTAGTGNLWWQRADGTGDAERLTESKITQLAGSWHPSGKYLAFQELSPQTGQDIMILPMEGDETSGWKPGKPTVFLNGPFNEVEPMFSPDGRWLAYFSNESGRPEVYVRPFPGPGGKWQISTDGGLFPTWSRTRRELYYGTPGQNKIMVASYTVDGASFRADKPRVWSSGSFTFRPRQRPFDLHPDGNRFALATPPEAQTAAKQDKVVFIFNFFDELRHLAPASRQ
jgi:serine/threonine-protein kinase